MKPTFGEWVLIITIGLVIFGMLTYLNIASSR